MKIENLSAGQIVYDVGTTRMGNTSMRTVSVWLVRIEAVDVEAGVVVASWNGNKARSYYKEAWSRWRKNKPVLVKSGLGHRLATRAEIAAMKAATP